MSYVICMQIVLANDKIFHLSPSGLSIRQHETHVAVATYHCRLCKDFTSLCYKVWFLVLSDLNVMIHKT